MADDLDHMEWAVDLEVSASIRHGRRLTVVMLAPEGRQLVARMRQRLEPIIRRCDPVFDLPEAMVVLMGETPPEGARQAVRRYAQALEGDIGLRYSMVAFPDDGQTSGELMAAGRSRLAAALDTAPTAGP